MKFVSFEKYKAYLESLGYTVEKGTDEFYDPIWMKSFYFSKEGEIDKYRVTCFCKLHKRPMELTGNIASIAFGHGDPILGHVKNVRIDMRKKFWKSLS